MNVMFSVLVLPNVLIAEVSLCLWCFALDECLYNTDKQLLKRLRTLCRNPATLRARNFKASHLLICINELCIRYFEDSFEVILK